MTLKTNINEVIQKMCECKRNNDIDGFYKYIDSLTIEEWLDLKEFTGVLNRLCISELDVKLRIIKYSDFNMKEWNYD